MNPNDPDMRWWIDQENRGLRTVACFSDCKRAHEDAAHGYGQPPQPSDKVVRLLKAGGTVCQTLDVITPKRGCHT